MAADPDNTDTTDAVTPIELPDPVVLDEVLPDSFVAKVHALDHRIDAWVGRRRGHPVVDRVYYGITELADFSLIWHLVAWTRALRSEDDLQAALRLSAALGVETVLVNGVIKSVFRRERPVHDGPRPHKLRVPKTTSFPSGHASSAAMAAVLLAEDDDLAPLYFALAAAVATSRVYVKIHHASDIVGGAVLGTALGLIARKVWPLHRDR